MHLIYLMPLTKRKPRALAMAGLLAFTLCTPGTPQYAASAATSRPKRKHAAARRRTLAGVPAFGEVTPTLYRGGQPTHKGFENLAKMGINIVVDVRVRRKQEPREVAQLGMRYVKIHWHCFHPEDQVFAEFLTLLRRNPDKKVFVHCRLGDDRTGMMIAAYRMVEQGWSPSAAMEEMEAYGFTYPHHMICPGLASYEANFPKRFRTSPAFRSLRSSELSLNGDPEWPGI